ncbi:MAG: dTMP kinase [Planctomycetota bacterium]|nr:MAG: dTMP kinase [Planctomycetota bacterium]
MRGRFIVFEGPDGSGKTTQFERFVARCRAAGLDVCEVREPGGTAIGERIREVLLDTRSSMSPRCEMLLYMASRAQLVEERIGPALASGEVVLADRFLASTLAYQGAAGVSEEDIRAVARAACGAAAPDLTLIYDVDDPTAEARMGPDRDRIERRGADYRARVRQRYRALAREDPAGFALIDASADADAVERRTLEVIAGRLG